MIETINRTSIDDRILTRVADNIGKGGLVALPTDTSFSIVCSMDSKEGIKRIKALSGPGGKPLTAICADLSQIGTLCEFGNAEFKLVKKYTPGPYVFILPALNQAVKRFDLKRSELGVRIPSHPFPVKLALTLGVPLLSVTAKKTMLSGFDVSDAGYESDLLFDEARELEDIHELSTIIDDREDRERIVSTVVRLGKDGVELIREGAGPWP